MFKKINLKKKFVVFYTTLFRVKIMLAYSCFIVILLFSSILQLVEFYGTHKKQIFVFDVLTGYSVSNPKFRFAYRFSGENGKSLPLYNTTYVTGSGKRDIFAQTMIFQYKRCCSKNVILFIIPKKIFLA